MEKIVTGNNFNKIKEQISKDKEAIFSSEDDELSRKALEKLQIKILLINLAKRKDFQKQRNSGFNQVLAKLAKKNNVVIGINLDEIISTDTNKAKSNILARVRQNIKLCNKNKLQMKFISLEEKNKKNSHDLRALGLVLGMPTWITKSF